MPDSSAEAHLPVDLTPKGDALRDRVFEAALGLFAEKGYHATSVDEILREAGVSKGGFYHHFKSKEDVLYAIKETFADYVRRGILEIDGNDASPSEKIRAVIRMLLGIIAQHRSHIVIFVQENGTLGPDRVAAIRSRHAASDHLVRSMVEAGVAEGEFRASIQPRIVTEALFGMCNWTYRWFDPGGEIAVDELADLYHSMLVRGLFA